LSYFFFFPFLTLLLVRGTWVLETTIGFLAQVANLAHRCLKIIPWSEENEAEIQARVTLDNDSRVWDTLEKQKWEIYLARKIVYPKVKNVALSAVLNFLILWSSMWEQSVYLLAVCPSSIPSWSSCHRVAYFRNWSHSELMMAIRVTSCPDQSLAAFGPIFHLSIQTVTCPIFSWISMGNVLNWKIQERVWNSFMCAFFLISKGRELRSERICKVRLAALSDPGWSNAALKRSISSKFYRGWAWSSIPWLSHEGVFSLSFL